MSRWKWVGLALAVVFFALAAFTIMTLDFLAAIALSIPDWRDWFSYPPLPIALA
jgi:hypothetical protein